MNQGRRQEVLRRLPPVDELLLAPMAQSLEREYSRGQLVEAVREALADVRRLVLTGEQADDWEVLVAPEALLGAAAERLAARGRPRLRRVLNASGVVAHTNLGRSRLAPAALERVVEAASHYSNLEYRLEEGERGSRHEHVEDLLCRLTGAPAAMVVNNNAAAVLLMLAGLAAGREVVVSRGQLVEIGGSFRVPAIMELSGARLREVGTTNKTHLRDYEAAIGPDTALILRVHTSNFKVVGFSEEVPLEELVALAGRHRLPVADDLGSGALAGLPAFADEPSVASSLAGGASVVSFSGDKLLGGPQAGILLGEEQIIAALKKHPLARAVRVDKMTLAGLEGTLLLYQDPAKALTEIPTLRFLGRSQESTRSLARRLAELLAPLSDRVELAVEDSKGKAGGGSLPLLDIPSAAVTLRPLHRNPSDLAAALRRAPLPVVGRVGHETLYLDCLALDEEELPSVAAAVEWALGDALAPAPESGRGPGPAPREDPDDQGAAGA
jgi:L-seryl-tRNA(Ser) seleniumtransferase